MAKRGRPRKQQPNANIMTLAEMLEQESSKTIEMSEEKKELEKVYIELAKLKVLVDDAHTRVSFVDEAETVSQIAFKAGRAYEKLSEALDKLTSILDDIYDENDFDYYESLN